MRVGGMIIFVTWLLVSAWATSFVMRQDVPSQVIE